VADRDAGVVIVGAGAAGSACAEALARDRRFSGSILMVGRDSDPPYERPHASKSYLRGETDRSAAYLHAAEWWAERGVELHLRTSAMKLDTGTHEIALSTKQTVRYGSAVLATGANVRRLRVPGAQLEGIHYLRALANADTIRADVESAERVVLVGGSYIACEVAASLTQLGKRCTMVMAERAPLCMGFGEDVGGFFARVLTEHGVDLVTADPLAGFEGAERVERVLTESGRAIDADAVVMGTGAVPDVMLARSAGLELGESGGIRCSARLETSAPGVWAAGDAAEYDSVLHGRRMRIEHWEVARAQGKAVAAAIAGRPADFDEVPYFWSDIADWVTVEYVGPAAQWEQEVVRGSLDAGEFAVFYLAGGRVAAALSVGRPEDLMHARRMLAERVDLAGREAALADPGTDLATLS
jgi:3-phenylpropionate/trans-cinnamate dioxygenase ferredoxin reductase component